MAITEGHHIARHCFSCQVLVEVRMQGLEQFVVQTIVKITKKGQAVIDHKVRHRQQLPWRPRCD